MKNLSTDPVQKPVDSPRASSATQAAASDWDMLAKFQPEPWVPVPPRKERLVMAALLSLVAIEGYVIYRMLT